MQNLDVVPSELILKLFKEFICVVIISRLIYFENKIAKNIYNYL